MARLTAGQFLLRVFSWVITMVWARPKVYGPFPKLDEPVIFVCRHVGLYDPVILMVKYISRIVHPLVARDYFEANKFTRWFYPLALCYPIERRSPSTEWMDNSLKALERGESIIIFPEGKRNKTGVGLLPFHSGAALLAAKSGARIVPVYNAFWHIPHRYRLAIGEPLSLDPVPEGGTNSAWLKEQTEKLRSAVSELGKLIPGE
ncbi:MAG: 1-acyl-sn-glycerol-3-phosphate acyltransferase [Bacteroidales bacterium]|nr:1-acyl-sn-glycerol-3-phosphate acyltransferase [Bacteroidales bacterium]